MISNPYFALLALLTLAAPALAAPTVYIPLGSGNVVIAVDAAKDEIVATYAGVENSHGIVADPDGEYLIAGSLKEERGNTAKGAISKLYVVHPEHSHVMLTVPVTGWTHHEAITPNGRYVISTHPTQGGISVLDMRSNEIVKTIKTGPAPNYTLISREGDTAYVSNSGNGTISEVDLASGQATRQLEAGPAPEHMVFSQDEQTIYVTNPRQGTVSAVPVVSGKVAHTYHIGEDTHGLDISDDKKTLFASSQKENRLVAIELASGKSRSVSLAPAPYHLNTIHGTGKVYVSSKKEPKIWVVDQDSLAVLGEIALPKGEGHQMAVVQ